MIYKFDCGKYRGSCCTVAGRHDKETMQDYLAFSRMDDAYVARFCKDHAANATSQYGWGRIERMQDLKLSCQKCLHFFPELLPNQKDGTLICQSCVGESK